MRFIIDGKKLFEIKKDLGVRNNEELVALFAATYQGFYISANSIRNQI